MKVTTVSFIVATDQVRVIRLHEQVASCFDIFFARVSGVGLM